MREERFDLLLSVIRNASELALELEKKGVKDFSKATNDYVTEADRAVEKLIRQTVLSSFPNDSFLGEESGGSEGESIWRWIVDPIDGTVNFMNHFPCYTVSIALERSGTIVAGAVCNPSSGELYHAFLGEGAWLNGKRIRSTVAALEKSLAIVVPPHRRHSALDAFWNVEKRIYSAVSDTRSIGSAALSLCQVACGRASLYYEWHLHNYDVASGLLIALEAGCTISVKGSDDDLSVYVRSSSCPEIEGVEL